MCTGARGRRGFGLLVVVGRWSGGKKKAEKVIFVHVNLHAHSHSLDLRFGASVVKCTLTCREPAT